MTRVLTKASSVKKFSTNFTKLGLKSTSSFIDFDSFCTGSEIFSFEIGFTTSLKFLVIE
ncbi:hypothetical protein LEP1GSC082_0846 [Leptospira kirschneri str. H2]|uniref:Uncharacterized protein n=2 Tax=Leptospira kirschneri TaxID=29507 RepID=A0A0E2AY94_9LEPT|nr:hypothetical protein LEP1GSC081_3107 [Leptospira kirschneri str. H1]EKO59100.1 hypothetical protein LEP1GSC082_0846 [Leptospira kirschneri str. H2]EMK10586.1 hypothetical protein LEP1GSC166_1632 [Leptospira kirschneri]EMK24904.1 hypothetical protein LEP1GSC008_0615 [Leptospira kirschneri serovar Bulgarica str. Nikolaevo]